MEKSEEAEGAGEVHGPFPEPVHGPLHPWSHLHLCPLCGRWWWCFTDPLAHVVDPPGRICGECKAPAQPS